MTGLRFLLAFAGLPLLGWPFVAGATRWLDPAARVATAAVAGAVLLTVEMMAATLIGFRFDVLPAVLAPAVWWFVRLFRRPKESERAPGALPAAGAVPALATAAAGLLLFSYAAATARLTATDLVLFWGPKGQAFAAAGRLDAGFLGNPANVQMHPDYPPLVPSLYAWATDAAGRFAWGASMLTLPLFLTLTAAALWGFGRPALGDRRAAEWTALLIFLLGYGWSVTLSGGGAEPALAFFEVVALVSLGFGAGRRAVPIASLALTGCTLTKLEGLPFACAVALAFSIGSSDWKTRLLRFAALLGAPLAALGAWIAFCAGHGLLHYYRGGGPLYLDHAPIVARVLPGVASYEAAYLPWIVVVALVALSPRSTGSRRPIVVALLFLAFMLFVYLHTPYDPTLLIIWSAGRLLLTVLTALLLAAASAEAGDIIAS